MPRIAFSGAHRTGKTTLAEQLATRHGFVMNQTDVASTFKKEKFNVLANQTGISGFIKGCEQQEVIIHHLTKKILEAGPNSVSDRCLIDSFAYTDYILGQRLSEFVPSEQHQAAFNHLRDMCIERFVLQDFTFIIQPGIPFVGVDKSPDQRSQEIINTLIIMAAQEHLGANRYFIMPREITSLEDRMAVIEDVLRVKKYIK